MSTIPVRARLRTSVAVFGTVLANGALRRLELAFAAFNVAEHATWVAILVYAFGRGGTAEAGLVALVQLLPAAAVAPVAALLGDRYPRQRVLAFAYLVQGTTMAAAAVALALGLPSPAVYAFAVAAAVSIVLTRPAQSSLLPAFARTPDELTAANVASGTIENAAVLVGPVLAGLLLQAAGPSAVYGVAGLALLGGLALVGTLRVRQTTGDAGSAAVTDDRASDRPTESASALALGGVRALAADPAARTIVALLALAWVVWGAIDVFAVMLAIDLLDLGEQGAGYLSSAVGAGGLVGSVLAVMLVGRARLAPWLLVGLVVWGLPLAIVGAAPVALVAFVAIAIAGSGRTIIDVSGRTLLQRVSDDDVLSRVFGVLEGLQIGALALGSIAAPVLVALAGERGALVASGVALPLVAAVSVRRLAALDATARVAADELRLLVGIPMFAPLPTPTLERLAGLLVPVTLPADAWVVREGEPGDRFYVIDSGTVEVSIAGRTVRALGAGESFGEIALLRDVPRTASVRATTPLRLLALDRAPFLAALTGQPLAQAVAERLVAGRLAPADGPVPAP